jgi:iron-sulfur cluster assembly accessory protein
MDAPTIGVSPAAAAKLRELRAGDPSRSFLRLYVAGRTCCSYQYGMVFEESLDAQDVVRESAGISFAIDPMSRPYCSGASIDFVDAPDGGGFLVQGPVIGDGCGCGRR